LVRAADLFGATHLKPVHRLMTDRLERSDARYSGAPAPQLGRDRGAPAGWREAARVLLRNRQGSAAGGGPRANGSGSGDYLERATCVSFQMDGVPMTPEEFRAALAPPGASRACRPRSAQRVRNHVAVLRRIESLLRRNQPLQPPDVIRWYTSIASGISAGAIDAFTSGRIERVVTSVNSPRLQFWPAVQEVAALHAGLLSDPFVPGFNGILARLLLRYHMGRCGLPPVVFDPVDDPPRLTSAPKLEARLLELIVQSYDTE
jgi:hypothetical protein